MKSIASSFALLDRSYPKRLTKEAEFGGKLPIKELRDFMAHTPGTPCCVQVSHAFNMAGLFVPESYDKKRRNASPIKINGKVFYYILAVDEMETWATGRFGPGELVSEPISDKTKKAQEVKARLDGRKGLLVMRDSGTGVHTEFWDGKSMLQTDMAVTHLLSLPRVLFWECTEE